MITHQSEDATFQAESGGRPMLLKWRSAIGAAVLFAILLESAFVYLPVARLDRYESDDYIFLSQIARHGLAESLVIPWNDHFIPLYRLFLGGLDHLFDTAVPIRFVILLFHLLNVWFIFHIVFTHTKSITLSSISSLVFGTALQPVFCFFSCINGHWLMSLSSILLMSICLDKFIEQLRDTASLSFPVGKQPEGDEGSANRPLETQSGVRALPYRPPLRYYYAGLASFVVGLGIFSLTLFAGVALWVYMYTRLLFIEKLRKRFWFHAKAILPFLVILAAYLMLRSYFNHKYYYYQIWWGMRLASPTEMPNMGLVAAMPKEFYLAAAKRMLPVQTKYYVPVLVLLGLLLIKELAFRWREAHVPTFWSILGLMTLAISVSGRIILRLVIAPVLGSVLEWRLFCYPVAAMSIVLGLLLRPPPFLERATSRLPGIVRGLVCTAFVGTLFVLTIGNAKTIEALADVKKEEQMQFYRVATQHKESMTLFLHSSRYSPGNKFFILNGPVAPFDKFPAGMFVAKDDLFQLYFPRIQNIHFVNQVQADEYKELYVWTARAVERENAR